MDPVWLSRVQFALTVGFHFIFPPLTIGLAWLIFWMMTRYRRSGSEADRSAVRFWTGLFVVSFAVGVATGITMEFQFGTNWSNYSRFVGDIFGAPLAAEGVFSFFLESTFLAVLVFGWNRVSTGKLWFASLMVAIGATLSAFWIIVANSWQQTPAGFMMRNGRAELTDFWAAVFNPSTMPRYLHTVDGCITTGAMFMMGISAWYLLKGRHVEFAKSSLRVGLVVGFVSALIQLPLGHHHGGQVARTQPEKLAAMEGIFKTERRAPSLVFGILDPEAQVVRAKIAIPGLLSWMAFGDFNAEVKGVDAFRKEDRPPMPYTFYTFRLMVMLGLWFVALTGFGLFLLWRKRLYENALFMKAAFWSIPLPFIAHQLGWFSAEVGRQPWAVYRMLRTSDAYSPSVPAGQILASIILLTAIYALLFAVWIFLLRKKVLQGPDERPGRGAVEQGVPA